MSKEQELLPCPFCGSGAAVLDGRSETVRARCERCGARGSVHYFDPEDDDQINTAEVEAANGWNARAALASPAAEPVQALTDGDMEFRKRIARLLAEMHMDEILSEQQCARYFGCGLVAWRRIEHSLTVGASFVETDEPESMPETSPVEDAIRAALARDEGAA